MRIKIKNARDSKNAETRDVFINNGLIAGFNLDGTFDLEIDASNFLLSPALIDPHAHLREPGQEVKEDLHSGLSAAVAGGFGTVVCMPNTKPVIDDPEILRSLIAKAEKLGLARLLPSAALTRGQEGKLLADAAAAGSSSSPGNFIAQSFTQTS